jgi:hypothetical protein
VPERELVRQRFLVVWLGLGCKFHVSKSQSNLSRLSALLVKAVQEWP